MDRVGTIAGIPGERPRPPTRERIIVNGRSSREAPPRRSGFPANKITEVRRMIDPTTATEPS